MIARYLSAISTGTAVTLGLLFVMQALIVRPDGALVEPPPRHPLIWDRTIIERPVEQQKEEHFETLKKPTPSPPVRPTAHTETQGAKLPLPGPQEPGGRHEPTFSPGFSDGPLVVIVRVEPQYPARAIAKELEGYVDVQFDVGPDGSVINVVVIKSSSAVFEASAVAAAKRFRYKSRVVNGVPQTTRGIRNRFTYRMDRA